MNLVFMVTLAHLVGTTVSNLKDLHTTQDYLAAILPPACLAVGLAIVDCIKNILTNHYSATADLNARSQVLIDALQPVDAGVHDSMQHQSDWRIASAAGAFRHVSVGRALSATVDLLDRYLVAAVGVWIIASVHLAFALALVPWLLYAARQRTVRLKSLYDLGSQPLEFQRADYLAELALERKTWLENRLFVFSPWLRSRYRETQLDAMAGIWQERLAEVRRLTPVTLLVVLSNGIVIYFAAQGYQAGSVTSTDMMRVVLGLGLLGALSSWTNSDNAFAFAVATPSLHRAWGRSSAGALDTAAPPALTESADLHSPPQFKQLTVDSVNLTYPNGTVSLKDVSLSLQPGEVLGIAGANGAGKSSLLDVMCGYLAPTSGAVTVNETHILNDERARAQWQSRVAPVLQATATLPVSIIENIDLLEGSQARKFLNSQTHLNVLGDVDDILGSDQEHGRDLSGGQRQILSVMRALNKRANSDLIVLDEANAHLDATTESLLMRSVIANNEGKSVVFVSHRMAAFKYATRIIVLDEGRIVESGTYDELMQADGRFSRMSRAQGERE